MHLSNSTRVKYEVATRKEVLILHLIEAQRLSTFSLSAPEASGRLCRALLYGAPKADSIEVCTFLCYCDDG